MLNDITDYLIQCSTHEVGKGNASRIASMLRVVAEFEEATDRIYRLVKTTQRKYQKNFAFTPTHEQELANLCNHVRSILDACANSLAGADGNLLEKAHQLENTIDALRKSHNRGALKRMQEGGEVVPAEMLYTELNNHLEAIGNHALN